MNMSREQLAKPLPTLLTKADAIAWCADMLMEMSGTLALVGIFNDVLVKRGPGGMDTASFPGGKAEGEDALNALKTIASGIVDKDIQMRVMQDAAKDLRAYANEQKLVEARAAAHGTSNHS